jgi:hypothetical protein
MATLVPTIDEGLSRDSRRHEQHSRSDPGGETLSPRVLGPARTRRTTGLVMDTLTGNYESDQVLVRDLLDRLAH